MRGREWCGLLLLVLGVSLWVWEAQWPLKLPEGPEGQRLYFYRRGFTRFSLKGLIGLVGVSATGVGAVLLARSLLGRIPHTTLRRIIGTVVVLAGLVPGAYAGIIVVWNLVAVASTDEIFREESPAGRSVVMDSFGHDPSAIHLYTEYDGHLYQEDHTARFEQPSFVNAEDCRLEDSGDRVELTCGMQSVTITPAATKEGTQ